MIRDLKRRVPWAWSGRIVKTKNTTYDQVLIDERCSPYGTVTRVSGRYLKGRRIVLRPRKENDKLQHEADKTRSRM